jgi:uncharacterized repeat protein (TIGR03803 family)
MANSRQFRSLTLGLSLGALAVAIVFVLAVAASPAAQAQTFHVIHTFTGRTDGGWPYAGVTIDKSGNLYGTTHAYGNPKGPYGPNWGVVYRLKPTGGNWTFNTLYTFTGVGDYPGKDGAFPSARVIFGPNGTLYGTTALGGDLNCNQGFGCGTVFKLTPPAVCKRSFCPWKETVLYAFKGEPDCANLGDNEAYGDLVFDHAGNIYGTTYNGGANNKGCVYKLTPSGTGGYREEVIHGFGGALDGQYPLAGVILDKAGNLYGTTSDFEEDYGRVYQLVRSSGGYTEKMLYFFSGGADGSYPFGGLIFDPSGNLYGSTENGGDSGAGTAFKLTPEGNGNWSYAALYSFAGGQYGGPYGNLARHGAGNLYGTTWGSGANLGNVFKLTPAGTYTSLHDFTGGSDGDHPFGNVTFDASGNLYGTASGGANGTCDSGCGVVWKITP